MGDGRLENIDAVHRTLQAVRILRSNVSYAFENLANGLRQSEEGEGGNEFLQELEQNFSVINTCMRNVEASSDNLMPPTGPLTLSNGGLLSLDPTDDRNALYANMIESYKWADKLHEFANHATPILLKNCFKRSLTSSMDFRRSNKRHRLPQVVPKQLIDNAIKTFGRQLSDMQIEIARPYGASTILQITLNKTLKAVVILRNFTVEHVIVRAYSEDFLNEDGKIDLWSNSRYKVFQMVTDHATVALLNYCSPMNPAISLKMFLNWLRSYGTLFTVPCNRCGNYLREFLPPTWRDFRNFAACHEACQ